MNNQIKINNNIAVAAARNLFSDTLAKVDEETQHKEILQLMLDMQDWVEQTDAEYWYMGAHAILSAICCKPNSRREDTK